jgi:Gpi18-like mannosyltransferase
MIIGALCTGLITRLLLLPYVSEDSSFFLLPWMEEFRAQGASALGDDFSNYNFPYLFLMFLASLLPLEPLIAVKLVSMVGEVLLAYSVAALVQTLRPTRFAPAALGAAALLLPTVLMNASMWGQCDAIYSAFILFSLRALLLRKGRAAWLWWGVAMAFKLQSVFFLPVLGLVTLRRGLKPAHVAMAAGVWLLLSLPPVLFGRSPASTLGTYAGQASEGGMVNGAMNIYQWFPDLTGAPGKTFALILCAAVLLVLSVFYWRGADTPDRTVLLAVTVLVACPLFLPQMHDRYFFTAEVASLLLLQRRLRFVVPALLALTGSYAYFVYFTENRLLWPLMLAALIQCVAFGLLVHALIQSRPQLITHTIPPGAQRALHPVHRVATPAGQPGRPPK